MLTIGLDAHLRTSTLCILEEDGRERKTVTLRCGADGVVDYLARLGEPFRIAFEASTNYGYLHDRFTPLAHDVQVAHAGKLTGIYRSKNKHDRHDARLIADLLKIGRLPKVWVPPVELRQWRRMIEHRRSLVAKRTRAKNAVRALLRTHAVKPPRRLWTKGGVKWLWGLQLPATEALQRDQLLMEIEHFDQMIERVERELDRIAADDPGVTILRSIRGIGPRTAEAIVAYVGDPHRFSRSNQIGSYFGLVPRQDESAGKARYGHITKDGPPTVRWLLVEATWQVIRCNPKVKTFFERVARGRKDRRKIALVATAHYLSRIMLQMLKTGECWRDEAAPADAATAGEAASTIAVNTKGKGKSRTKRVSKASNPAPPADRMPAA